MTLERTQRVRSKGATSLQEHATATDEMKADEALEWLVEFAQLDLSHAPSWQVQRCVWQLRRYLGEASLEDELRQAEQDPARLDPAITVAREFIEAVADSQKGKHWDY